MVVNNPLVRPHFLGTVALGGYPWISMNVINHWFPLIRPYALLGPYFLGGVVALKFEQS